MRKIINPLYCLLLLWLSTTADAIGINYGTLGDNLPTPAKVANFLKTKTIIDSVKLFDANPAILRAFADTGLSVTVTIANGQIPSLTNLDNAKGWISKNIAPFHPQTRINRILVGNEIMATLDDNLISNLVPAMKAVHQALLGSGINDIKVTTAHSMGILKVSEPPSAGKFWPGHDVAIYGPMLQFLRQTKSPFMVNPYSYFGYSPSMANYALFRSNPGIHDPDTDITYSNMFDATLDATYSAMKKLGYEDVDLIVGETGWPTKCLPQQLECNVENAAWYNSQLVHRAVDGVGTPLEPKRRIGIFLFALFNENLKPGPITEQHWGLFEPDFTPVYDCGVLRSDQKEEKSEENEKKKKEEEEEAVGHHTTKESDSEPVSAPLSSPGAASPHTPSIPKPAAKASSPSSGATHLMLSLPIFLLIAIQRLGLLLLLSG
ncbi:Glucan endo-1,3-beta-glucosidase [Linum grandiflorum]